MAKNNNGNSNPKVKGILSVRQKNFRFLRFIRSFESVRVGLGRYRGIVWFKEAVF